MVVFILILIYIIFMKLNYCYHTHTTRCSHAYGSDEEYVIEAIKKGLKVIGFTDHVFLPNHSQQGIRGDYALLDDYLKSLNYLKEKYKDQIQILIGFEAEYLEEYLPHYRYLFDSGKIDYLIQGQHNYIEDGVLKWYFAHKDNHEIIELYLTHIIKGMESGLFSYIAHPDLFVSGITKWDDFAISVARRICEASIKYDCPIEFNLGGKRFPYDELYPGRQSLRYPCPEFWEIAKEYPIKVFIGADAHKPSQVNDEIEIDYAINKMKKLGIQVLEDIRKR